MEKSAIMMRFLYNLRYYSILLISILTIGRYGCESSLNKQHESHQPSQTANEQSSNIKITDKLFNEINGSWCLRNRIMGEGFEIERNLNLTLEIENGKVTKFLNGQKYASANLKIELVNKRKLYFWTGFDEMYMRYIPERDEIILNLKGFDGVIEYYKRCKN